MMNIDELIHDDHKHLKNKLHHYQSLEKDFLRKEIIISNSYYCLVISINILPAFSNKTSVISGNDVLKKRRNDFQTNL
jgi:hypothetical protein